MSITQHWYVLRYIYRAPSGALNTNRRVKHLRETISRLPLGAPLRASPQGAHSASVLLTVGSGRRGVPKLCVAPNSCYTGLRVQFWTEYVKKRLSLNWCILAF